MNANTPLNFVIYNPIQLFRVMLTVLATQKSPTEAKKIPGVCSLPTDTQIHLMPRLCQFLMIYHNSQIRYFTNRPFISISIPLLFSSKADFSTLVSGFGYPWSLTRARTAHSERSYRYVDSSIPQLSMPPLSLSQKQTKKFRRRTDGSFWQLLPLSHEDMTVWRPPP
jgi:hypothetical protein